MNSRSALTVLFFVVAAGSLFARPYVGMSPPPPYCSKGERGYYCPESYHLGNQFRIVARVSSDRVLTLRIVAQAVSPRQGDFGSYCPRVMLRTRFSRQRNPEDRPRKQRPGNEKWPILPYLFPRRLPQLNFPWPINREPIVALSHTLVATGAFLHSAKPYAVSTACILLLRDKTKLDLLRDIFTSDKRRREVDFFLDELGRNGFLQAYYCRGGQNIRSLRISCQYCRLDEAVSFQSSRVR